MTTLREKLVKIDARVVRHGRYATFQLTVVAIPKTLFAEILRRIDGLRPATLRAQMQKMGWRDAFGRSKLIWERSNGGCRIHFDALLRRRAMTGWHLSAIIAAVLALMTSGSSVAQEPSQAVILLKQTKSTKTDVLLGNSTAQLFEWRIDDFSDPSLILSVVTLQGRHIEVCARSAIES